MHYTGPNSKELDHLYTEYPDVYDRESEAAKADPFGDRGGFECGPGWADLLTDLGEIFRVLGVRVAQVKEKFGLLCIHFPFNAYISTPTAWHAAMAAANLAAKVSGMTCEACGAEGQRRGGAWLRTLCKGCERDYSSGRWQKRWDAERSR